MMTYHEEQAFNKMANLLAVLLAIAWIFLTFYLGEFITKCLPDYKKEIIYFVIAISYFPITSILWHGIKNMLKRKDIKINGGLE